MSAHPPPTSRHAAFPDTRWTLVVSSRGTDTRSRRAMDELCRGYWYPIYAHARGKGFSPADAEDLTQTLFARLLSGGAMERVSPEAGRLRSYLLKSMDHVIAQDWRDRRTQKRGGGAAHIPIDGVAAESRYACELADPGDPVREFNRRWALTLLDTVLEQLRQEYEKQDAAAVFNALSPFLSGPVAPRSENSPARAAEGLGITEGHFRVLLFRMRKRFRKLLRAEILDTVASPELVNEEIACLFQTLAER